MGWCGLVWAGGLVAGGLVCCWAGAHVGLIEWGNGFVAECRAYLAHTCIMLLFVFGLRVLVGWSADFGFGFV